jgi:hypothetical protein
MESGNKSVQIRVRNEELLRMQFLPPQLNMAWKRKTVETGLIDVT